MIFVILTLALVGGYLAFSIPVAVFPATNFPRILIAVDNGVMPTDQMMVTITRPIEEAVNSVPGLQEVRSITSRGSAEIDLFFDWNVDMFQTLQYVNAALSRVQTELPPTASVVANRMTFASFPIIGYSLTSPNRSANPTLGDGNLRDQAATEPAGRRVHGAGAGRTGAGIPHHARSRRNC